MNSSRSRWSVLIAYASVAAASQTLWLTYAPVTTVAADHYGVSIGAIGWLANIEPLLYVLLALPAGLLLDRSFRSSLAAGAILSAIGAIVRLLGDDYSWALIGQLIAAVAQPLLLSAIAKVAREYLTEKDRPAGIALGACSLTAGQLLAIVLGAALSAPDQIPDLELIGAVFAAVSAIVLVLCLLRPSPYPSGRVAAGLESLRVVWSDRAIRIMCGVVFLGFGIYIAETTWLQALLEPAGITASSAGVLLVIMLVAGTIGAATLPTTIARRNAQPAMLFASVIVGIVAALALAVAPGFGVGVAVLAVSGFLNVAALPVILELAERRAGAAGGAVASLVWLAGNAGGLVVALSVQALVDTPAAAFTLLAVFGLLAVPLLVALRKRIA
ncbi:MFS transporter [Antrihabitans cavernicola]|uniref:MFS transporter n=1 Tax=Antrihabitans cavernicola TaxID=2495913 RepID=UPI00165984E0|nr:MFS transporter [Spelaeibacter cavernicola]